MCLMLLRLAVFFWHKTPLSVKNLTQLTGLPTDTFRAWFTFALALHDLGKFAESFQNLRPQILNKLQDTVSKRKYAHKA